MYQSRDRVNRVLVSISLLDGGTLMASMRMPLSNKVIDALNNPDPFLDILTPGGEQQFVAKAAIKSVRSMEMPKAEQLDLDAKAQALANADPYVILKLEKSATPEEIRQAYHRMARLYHPDRIASYELPEEVKDYARAMLVRINLAFEQIRH
jgi:hypothetical protein